MQRADLGTSARRLIPCAVRLTGFGMALALAAGGTCALAEAAAPRLSSASPAPRTAIVTEAALRFRLPSAWLEAVIGVESAGVPRAVSGKGAMGLMQLMPATWKTMSEREKLGADPFDIRANVLAGAAYLRAMIDRYGDFASALAAYNAGPGRVDDWRRSGRPLPAETSNYVARIGARLGLAAMTTGSVVAAEPPLVPPDWRASSLFHGGPPVDHGPSAIAVSDTGPDAVLPAFSPSSAGLFVTVSRGNVP
jgi:soluble lytic murein transglycosylase-like protein